MPDARVKDRQRACSSPECQTTRRKETQAAWRDANAGYFIAYRIEQRAAALSERSPSRPAAATEDLSSAASIAPVTSPSRAPPMASAPRRMPAPLDQLPWDLAKDEFGTQGADFIAVLGKVLLSAAQSESKAAKDVMRVQEVAMT